jgi:hypothetical protein
VGFRLQAEVPRALFSLFRLTAEATGTRDARPDRLICLTPARFRSTILMPNWTEQTLHVVGPTSEIDRFIRTGFTRRGRDQFDDLLHFTRLCPPNKREPKSTDTHDSGVILQHYRTRTQAMFEMITSWNYPAEFYARLGTHWPRLAFVCSVNGEMGDFGGVIVTVDGRTQNLVRNYEIGYNRRTHAREIGTLLRGRWMEILQGDRPCRLMPKEPWLLKSMPFDAHFDDDFWFYFRTMDELAAFKARYPSSLVMRRTGETWHTARVPAAGRRKKTRRTRTAANSARRSRARATPPRSRRT